MEKSESLNKEESAEMKEQKGSSPAGNLGEMRSLNFIEEIVEEDLKSGKYDRIITQIGRAHV